MAESFTNLDPVLYPDMQDAEPGGSAVTWSAIWAGTVAAIALSLILLAVGSGFGLASISPWPGTGPKATSFTIAAGIWLIVTQWLASATGGYITGRMRVKWRGLHTHEVFFRDTVHGLITWSVATILVAVVAVTLTTLASLGTAPVTPDLTAAAADEARKAAAMISIFSGLSMLVGAFVACVAAAIGGQLRDEHPS